MKPRGSLKLRGNTIVRDDGTPYAHVEYPDTEEGRNGFLIHVNEEILTKDLVGDLVDILIEIEERM